ncbi:MAG: hypothetical protein JJU00_11890 [Opitutales bacterium]|nr:hypothetical protein [Opitutales bacterium]
MRTTIDISDALLAELRQRAADTRRPFRAVVEDTLQAGLAGAGSARTSSSPPKLKSYPLGIKAAYRGVSLNQLYDQLEAESTLSVAEE